MDGTGHFVKCDLNFWPYHFLVKHEKPVVIFVISDPAPPPLPPSITIGYGITKLTL